VSKYDWLNHILSARIGKVAIGKPLFHSIQERKNAHLFCIALQRNVKISKKNALGVSLAQPCE